MDVPGIGGPIITGGGVAFLAASVDDYLRVYDLTTGEQIWGERLPAGQPEWGVNGATNFFQCSRFLNNYRSILLTKEAFLG